MPDSLISEAIPLGKETLRFTQAGNNNVRIYVYIYVLGIKVIQNTWVKHDFLF